VSARKRPQQGTVQQQLGALDEQATDAAGRLRAVELVLEVYGFLGGTERAPQPASWPPAGYPPSPRMVRRHGLRLVKGGAR
jgi:hypothetical protein